MSFKKSLLILLAAVICLSTDILFAQPSIRVTVQTVFASSDSSYVDPKLSSLIQELRSVFRYTSYKLLNQNNLHSQINKTDTITLPGQRKLKVTPLGIDGDRVQLDLVILKSGKQIFQTRIKLLNNSSLIVGGPKHDNGYLLFNIFSSF